MKGTYALIIENNQDSTIKVGRLGEINFLPGIYVYSGSALNSLNARINRHLSPFKKLHYHVDYLLDSIHCRVGEVVYVESSQKLECALASSLSTLGVEVPQFGSSDCQCPSHLYYFNSIDQAIEICRKFFLKLKLNPQCLIDLPEKKF